MMKREATTALTHRFGDLVREGATADPTFADALLSGG